MSGWTYNAPSGSSTDGPQITSIAVVFTAVALLTVLLRVYVRGFMLKSVGADDWIIIATWIASCGFAVVTVIQTKWGLGLKKLDDLPQQNYYNFMLLQFMGAPFYISSILGFKLSLLISYLRFMASGIWYKVTVGVAVACTLFHISFLIAQINLCTPVRKQWDLSITHGSCLKGVPMYTTMASITIVFDVVVMMLPFPTLLKLQMPNRKKVVLLGLFAMGIFISIIQIVRIQTIKSLSNLLDSAGLIKWSMVENNLGIIVACVPTLAPLVRYFSEQSRVGSRSRSKSQNNSGYALQSTYRKNLSRRSGLQPLGSGVDEQIGDSAEDILAKEDGIMRKTEIVISSAQGPADRGELTPGHYHGR
ncbi:integral membrane protein PTH11 [Fusarium fujikuroi]|nr:integral membrane protein PTH11 [Fusarium fujikuroi]